MDTYITALAICIIPATNGRRINTPLLPPAQTQASPKSEMSIPPQSPPRLLPSPQPKKHRLHRRRTTTHNPRNRAAPPLKGQLRHTQSPPAAEGMLLRNPAPNRRGLRERAGVVRRRRPGRRGCDADCVAGWCVRVEGVLGCGGKAE